MRVVFLYSSSLYRDSIAVFRGAELSGEGFLVVAGSVYRGSMQREEIRCRQDQGTADGVRGLMSRALGLVLRRKSSGWREQGGNGARPLRMASKGSRKSRKKGLRGAGCEEATGLRCDCKEARRGRDSRYDDAG